ncbi:hypothetical protein GB931_11705 [Modestobacter sp. I12A-02628]|uniref:Uncharacterized protein n=1 Tax=Goekera deserti TaxID=2497753 RepID=A0A7K3WEN8_9ACTN|nr:hypothetical protein [Goekera deserti]MPQ98571.1 hypothetical protein [Goekera deserti]NDI49059.1 hypothetical protein [Goekera deserti]NEL54150.1 hypothetical protein [Goekera deserti]
MAGTRVDAADTQEAAEVFWKRWETATGVVVAVPAGPGQEWTVEVRTAAGEVFRSRVAAPPGGRGLVPPVLHQVVRLRFAARSRAVRFDADDPGLRRPAPPAPARPLRPPASRATAPGMRTDQRLLAELTAQRRALAALSREPSVLGLELPPEVVGALRPACCSRSPR